MHRGKADAKAPGAHVVVVAMGWVHYAVIDSKKLAFEISRQTDDDAVERFEDDEKRFNTTMVDWNSENYDRSILSKQLSAMSAEESCSVVRVVKAAELLSCEDLSEPFFCQYLKRYGAVRIVSETDEAEMQRIKNKRYRFIEKIW